MTTQADRHLPYDTVFNFRDVGGYRTRDGRRLRWRRLFRAAALHDVSPRDAAAIHADLGTAAILDLRRPDEIASESPDLGPLVARVPRRENFCLIPLPVEPPPGGDVRVAATLDEQYGRGPSGARYGAYLEGGAAAGAAAVAALCEPAVYPALVHCTAGKDRTGVLIALVLDLLGVPDETIVRDYALSGGVVRPFVANGRIPAGTPAHELDAFYGAPPQAMRDFLALLRQRHGSARGYLRAQGLPSAQLERLPQLLLE